MYYLLKNDKIREKRLKNETCSFCIRLCKIYINYDKSRAILFHLIIGLN